MRNELQDCVHPDAQKELKKLYKKDKVRYEYVKKRLIVLAEKPENGKPLRNLLKGKWRVHIGSFVLMYTIDNKNNTISLLSFKHHDSAYE